MLVWRYNVPDASLWQQTRCLYRGWWLQLSRFPCIWLVRATLFKYPNFSWKEKEDRWEHHHWTKIEHPIPTEMSSSILFRSSIRSFKVLQPITRTLRPTILPTKFRPVVPVFFAQRNYAGSVPEDEVEKRIIEILKGFDKVTDPTKVRPLPFPCPLSPRSLLWMLIHFADWFRFTFLEWFGTW